MNVAAGSLKAVFKKIESLNGYDGAQTMPSEFYTSNSVMEAEKQLLAQEWMCVGRADEIPESGDYFTTSLMGEPLLVCRSKSGQIRVLSNVCRHRGNTIANGKGNRSRFTCSYHAWTYADDGELIGAPLMNEVTKFDKASCRLPEFNSEIWQGFIYVNLDSNAEPLAPRLESLAERVSGYQADSMKACHSVEVVLPTNWKLAAENFMESYHLSCVHKKTIHPFTPTSLARYFPSEDGYSGYYANYPENQVLRGGAAPTLSEEDRHRTAMFWVMPSHVVALAGHVGTYLCLQPLEPGKVKVKIGVMVYDADNLDADEIETMVKLFLNTLEEDKVELEKIYRGLCSHYFEPGPLAPVDLEGTLWDFYRYMAQNLKL